jgi:phosphatidylglycerophosphate synthase
MPAPPQTRQSAAVGWILERDPKAAGLCIFGLTPGDRLLRALWRAGCTPLRIGEGEAPPLATGERVAVLCADRILDERIVQALVATPDTWLVHPSLGALGAQVGASDTAAAVAALRGQGEPPARLRRIAPDALVPGYQAELRKSEPPWVFAALPELADDLEARVFDASYKGVTDLVTKWVWPRPARAVTRWCAAHGITPNAVTLASWVLALGAVALFATGRFGSGLLVAWCMTFLDTVDGKLARVTLTSSRLGSALDHGLDLLHPPFWYLAWGFGLASGRPVATAIAVAGYIAGRLLEGLFLGAFRFEIHSWRPIDALFRTITARRNPNLILLTVGALGGRPDLGLVMVASWTAASLGFHAVRLAQAFAARRRGEPVAAWGRE